MSPISEAMSQGHGVPTVMGDVKGMRRHASAQEAAGDCPLASKQFEAVDGGPR